MFAKDLTNEQIRQIKEKLEAGEKIGDVAQQFGITTMQYQTLIDRVIQECGKSKTLSKIKKQIKDFYKTW